MNLNFTWNVTNFENDLLELSLIFEQPNEISRYEENDALFIHFYENSTDLFTSIKSEKIL